MAKKGRYALVLSGGGARGAYQAGVVRGIYEIASEVGNLDMFRTISGVSAGAINASYLASQIDNLDVATQQMCEMWRTLEAESVFKTDYSTVTKNALRLFRGVSLGGFSEKLRPVSVGLLNTAPLRELLSNAIPFGRIKDHIKSGKLNALCISATDYSTSVGITFVQGQPDLPDWKSANRISLKSEITVDHIMASSAIPLFFPPIVVDGRNFGDGCLRNMAPLSPAVHLHAEKLLVIGVRRWRDVDLATAPNLQPSLGRVLSVLINAIFMDAVEIDLDRIHIINQTVNQLKAAGVQTKFRAIDALYIHPSEGLSDIAQSRENDLPKIIRFLMHGLGTSEEAAEILSYLLFEPGYCGSLVDLGYRDAIARKTEFVKYLSP